MKPTQLLALCLMSLLAISCNEKKKTSKEFNPLDTVQVVDMPESNDPDFMIKDTEGFPKVKNLSNYKQTTFLFAPECGIPAGKNAIYCSTLGIAWDQISALFQSSYKIENEYIDLQLLDKSKWYVNSLKKGEYETTITVNAEQQKIAAKVKFNKALPFETVFDSSPDNDFTFNNSKVASFSASGGYVTYNNQIDILYYENDNNFIIKLQPKDPNHEILLYLPKQKPETLSQAFENFKALRKKGNRERKSNWRYEMILGDYIVIPKLSFNIESEYNSMTGSKIIAGSGNLPFEISEMKQQTAFMLDEYGAKIEGQATAEVATADEGRKDKPIPKKLHFNKPFLIMLKRKDSPNPYFAMWVENTELMQK